MAAPSETILVVEDDEFFRSLLLQRLREEGYVRLIPAADGQEALHAARKASVDLVLLDMELPVLNGIDVLRVLKADPELKNIPVIVISGVEDLGSVVRCIELGAEDYLSKPFNPVLLRARIGASLEKRRLRKLETLRMEQIVREQKRSDALLKVILPATAADELRAKGSVAPRRHDQVAVLFCDIVGFTAYCEEHDPEGVVDRLQSMVERFEEITEAHGMEKIKTIGDSFMATAGMLWSNSAPLAAAVRCGLAMIAATPAIVPGWEVRVGVDCGALVSGVLGRQKYQFDVWGSVVNTASRVTEFASPSAIALRREAAGALGPEFACRPLGTRALKGLGDMELAECTGYRAGALPPAPR